jgi:hypothetical protein
MESIMTDQHVNEKREKAIEKEDEKSPHEKSWDEKWQRDPISAVVWALIFIWAGLVLLANNLNYLDRWISPQINIPGMGLFPGLEVWAIIFIGAGIIIFGEVIVRLLVPAYRKPIGGSLFCAIFLIGIGFGNIFGWNIIWPLILIALGISVLLRGLVRYK